MLEHDPATPTPRTGEVLLLGKAPRRAVGIVTAVTIPAPAVQDDASELWIAEVSLSGVLDEASGFTRGGGTTPALGDQACLAGEADLGRLYGGETGQFGQIGRVPLCARIPALSSGFGIFGGRGTGKSSTLAVLLRTMLRARAPVRPILLDPHDEYGRSFGRAARILRPGPGFAPHWLLTVEELAWVLSLNGGTLAEDERALLEEAIPAARRRMLQRSGSDGGQPFSVDGPLPYRVMDLLGWLDRNASSDQTQRAAAHRRLRSRLATSLGDARLSVIFGRVSAEDTLGALLRSVFCLGSGAAPMSVIQLGGLPLGIDRLIAGVICRLAGALGEGTGGALPLLVVLEDADRFAPEGAAEGATKLCRDAVHMLVQDGPKHGIGLGVVSSHPAGVSQRVLGDLPTLLTHRLPSEADRRRLRDCAPDSIASLLDGAGTLGERQLIGAGEGMPAPGMPVVDELPEAAVPVRAGRRAEVKSPSFVEDVIDRWRFGDSAGSEEAAAAPRPARRRAAATPVA
nr:ATP-binding protein [Parvularcula dongshanensis]